MHDEKEEIVLRGMDLLNELNRNVHNWLDEPEEKRRESIEKYLAWIRYYDNLLENSPPEQKTFNLYGDIGMTDLDGVKFIRAFWLDAMVMFIQKKQKKPEICS